MHRIVIATWVIALVGCSSGTGTNAQAGTNNQERPRGSASACAPAVRPEASVGELLTSIVPDTAGSLEPDKWVAFEQIKAVVVGTVTDFERGPILHAYHEYEGDDGEGSLVMKVKVTQMYKGKLPSSGFVYVQVRTSRSPSEAQAALPSCTRLALYLEGPIRNKPEYAIRHYAAGRPHGSPLWGVSPLAFVVDNGAGSGVSLPMMGEVKPATSFESLVPTVR